MRGRIGGARRAVPAGRPTKPRRCPAGPCARSPGSPPGRRGAETRSPSGSDGSPPACSDRRRPAWTGRPATADGAGVGAAVGRSLAAREGGPGPGRPHGWCRRPGPRRRTLARTRAYAHEDRSKDRQGDTSDRVHSGAGGGPSRVSSASVRREASFRRGTSAPRGRPRAVTPPCAGIPPALWGSPARAGTPRRSWPSPAPRAAPRNRPIRGRPSRTRR